MEQEFSSGQVGQAEQERSQLVCLRARRQQKRRYADRPGAWDRGHNYYMLKAKLLEMFEQTRNVIGMDRRFVSRFIYLTIALIQLTNGLRAGEAVYALYEWIKTGHTELELRTEKSNTYRPVFIPRELIPHYPQIRMAWGEMLTRISTLDIRHIKKGYINWMRRTLVNTHTLRYAFIRRLIDERVPADLIALILGHKKVETTYRYEKAYDARKLFKELYYSGKL